MLSFTIGRFHILAVQPVGRLPSKLSKFGFGNRFAVLPYAALPKLEYNKTAKIPAHVIPEFIVISLSIIGDSGVELGHYRICNNA
jgi:hypothetical protein